jgi:hypothetical protein
LRKRIIEAKLRGDTENKIAADWQRAAV